MPFISEIKGTYLGDKRHLSLSPLSPCFRGVNYFLIPTLLADVAVLDPHGEVDRIFRHPAFTDITAKVYPRPTVNW